MFSPATLGPSDRQPFFLAIIIMALIVLASNILVQHPVQYWGLQDYLTFGAFTYPFAFLVTTCRIGASARSWRGGWSMSVLPIRGGAVDLFLPRRRIANRLRLGLPRGASDRYRRVQPPARFAWWLPPLVSSVIASGIDTAIFFSFAFHCGPVS